MPVERRWRRRRGASVRPAIGRWRGGYAEAGTAAAELARRERMTLVHAFDDPQVVAGQEPIGIEIADERRT